MGNKHMKRCLKSLVISEIQTKTIMSYCFTAAEKAIIKKKKKGYNKYWKDCGETRGLIHGWWKCKMLQPLWKTIWNSSKCSTQNSHMTQQFHS